METISSLDRPRTVAWGLVVTGLGVERVWPYGVSIVTVAAWWWIGAPFPKDFTALIAAAGTVAAVLVGFLSTAKVVILGITGSEVFQILKKAGYIDIYMKYVRAAIYGTLALLVISMLGFFLEPIQNPNIHDVALKGFPFLWILLSSFAVCAFLRVTNLLFNLLKHV